MKENIDFKNKLTECFDELAKRDKDVESRLKQLESDIGVIAGHLGFIRHYTGELVHEDKPATKADGEYLISEIQKRFYKKRKEE